MPVVHRVEISSRLAADAEEVWRAAVTPAGVNHELGPWLRMTVPRAWAGRGIDEVPLGVPIGRSWLLLGGVLPVDFDELCLVERGERSFHERSRMGSARVWEHQRAVIALPGGGCQVTDRLAIDLRAPLRWVPGSGRLARAIMRALFGHRHRRLRARHGAR